jgi:hypothetical protein
MLHRGVRETRAIVIKPFLNGSWPKTSLRGWRQPVARNNVGKPGWLPKLQTVVRGKRGNFGDLR